MNQYTLVVSVHPYAGFFSNFNCVLNHLHHTLGHRGVVAVRVNWQVTEAHKMFPYGTPVDGNLWDRFFEPLTFDYYPDAIIETDVYADARMTGLPAYLYMYKLGGQTRRRQYYRAYERHIRLRPHMEERIGAFYDRHLRGHYCVGVHFRNRRHSVDCPEPIPRIAEFIDRTSELIRERPDARVFLATDVEAAVEQFEAAFAGQVAVLPDVRRASGDRDVHWHHRSEGGSLRDGEDAIADCFLLARCDTLLHVTSNVATAAACLNPELRLVYCERSAWRGLRRYPIARGRSVAARCRHVLRSAWGRTGHAPA